MVERIHRSIGGLLWYGMIAAIILAAVYVTSARSLLEALPRFKTEVVSTLSQQLGVNLAVNQVSGRLVGFAPQLELSGVVMSLATDSAENLSIDTAAVRLDPWASVLALEPRLDALELRGAALSFANPLGNGSAKTDQQVALAGLLRNFRRVTVADSQLQLLLDNGEFLPVATTLDLYRDGNARQFRLTLTRDESTELILTGSGVGDPLAPDRFAGDIHAHLRAAEISEFAQWMGLDARGQGEIELWYRVNDGQPVLTSTLQLQHMSAAVPVIGPITLDQMTTTLRWRQGERGWQAHFQNTRLVHANTELVIDRSYIEQRGAGLRVLLGQLAVSDVTQLLLASGVISGPAAEVVADLSPQGDVRALEAVVANIAEPTVGWSLQAQVRDATTQPYEGVPGLYGIDATLEATEAGAVAWIDTENFTLDLPRVYRAPITLPRLQGRLHGRWGRDFLVLEHGVLAADAGDHTAMAMFGIDIPFTAETAQTLPLVMTLSVGLDSANVGIRDRYIPYTVAPALYDWLGQALPSGELAGGVFHWRGEFSEFGSGRQSMQLALELRDASVDFQAEWPSIDDLQGRLLVDTASVSVWGTQARMGSVSLETLSAEVISVSGRPQLLARTAVNAGVGDALALLRQTPINDRAGALLADFTATGRATGNVRLSLDLADMTADPGVDVALRLEAARLQSSALQLALDDISGGLAYRYDSGFSANELSATLFDAPVTIGIAPGTSGFTDAALFDARFSSRQSSVAISRWLSEVFDSPADIAELLELTGEADFRVDVAVGDKAQVRVRSDLVGWALGLPAPVGKPAALATPLQLEFSLAEDAPWYVFWQNRLSARLHRYDGQLVGATVDLTPRVESVALPEAVMTESVFVGGTLPQLSLQPWLDRIDRWSQSAGSDLQLPPISIDKLAVKSVVWGSKQLGAMQLDLTPYEDWDMLGLNADWLDAELTLRRDQRRSALIINSLNLDRLLESTPKSASERDSERANEGANAVANESSSASQTAAGQSLLGGAPPTLRAPINVVVANLIRGDEDLGAVTFNLNSRNGELVASNIRGNLADLDLREGSELRWSEREPGRFSTDLVINGHLDDLGRSFRLLGIEPVAETRSGTLGAHISWPGSPADVDVMALAGVVDVTLREGSFLPVPAGATGFLRILSLFNLAGLFERANVTRLFDPGVAFREARGELVFDRGHIAIPQFVVDGSGGGFEFDSDIDLISETIDGELVVTLPLAENIPWVAALAGGLPIAAGAYLASKVFEDQVKSLSSGVYSVSGELSQPSVKFVRVFDASSKKVRQPANSAPPATSEDSGTAVGDKDNQTSASEPSSPPPDSPPPASPAAASSSSRK